MNYILQQKNEKNDKFCPKDFLLKITFGQKNEKNNKFCPKDIRQINEKNDKFCPKF